MSSDLPRLEFALHCIANIETVVERHGDVVAALAELICREKLPELRRKIEDGL
ncbi:hypothetical protein [Endothiovibrio diazotrophicus]